MAWPGACSLSNPRKWWPLPHYFFLDISIYVGYYSQCILFKEADFQHSAQFGAYLKLNGKIL